MNNIGQSLLPIAPATPETPMQGGFGNETPSGGDSFESLLQLLSGDAVDGLTLPVEEPAKAATEPDAVEALAEAGLFLAPPVVTTFPAPVPEPVAPLNGTDESDGTNARVVAEGAVREASAPPPESVAGIATPSVNAKSPLPILSPARRIAFAAAPQSEPASPEALPQPDSKRQDAPQPPQPSTVHDLASLSGIALPVQAAPLASIEAAASSAPVASVQRAPLSVRTIASERQSAALPAIEPARAREVASSIEAIAVTPKVELQTVLDPKLETPAAPALKPTSAPAHPIADAEPQPSLATAAVNPEPNIITGMTAAKPGDAMPAPTIQRLPRTARATSAEPISTAATPTVTTPDRTQTLRDAPLAAAQNGREHSPNDHAENTDRTAFPEIAANNISQQPPTTNANTDPVAPVRAADVAQVVEHTVRATEQLRASGHERIEVAVKLDSGHDITIQLHVANGEVMPVIRTESEPLRLALEQNWTLFSQRGGDRELRVNTPVFESPQTSSNMSDLNQQRDGRQRAQQDTVPDYLYPQSLRRNAPHNPQHSAASSPAPSVGVRHYA